MSDTPLTPTGRKRETGFRCPDCGGCMRCVRTLPAAGVTTRRRQCPACKAKITTVEKPVNRAVPTATASAEVALSIGDLLRTLGLTPADLGGSVSLPVGEPRHE